MQYFFFSLKVTSSKVLDYEPGPKVVIFNQYLFQSTSHKVTARPVCLILYAADVLASPHSSSSFHPPPPPPHTETTVGHESEGSIYFVFPCGVNWRGTVPRPHRAPSSGEFLCQP